MKNTLAAAVHIIIYDDKLKLTLLLAAKHDTKLCDLRGKESRTSSNSLQRSVSLVIFLWSITLGTFFFHFLVLFKANEKQRN